MKKILSILLSLIITASFFKIETAAVISDVSAKAAVLIEAQTGSVIYSKNENMRLPMASTTKIMTTLVTLESGDLDSEFMIDDEALLTEGSSMYLCEGDVVTKRELCYGMMLPSGNDAANAAALKIGGDYENFSRIMNDRAYKIGMKNTSFVTPSGLHDDNHYSSAYDMALLAREALKNDVFKEICSTKSIKLTDDSWSSAKYLTNSNKLLSRYDGCVGVKTGFTDEAGRCLVSAAERDGVKLIAVTLNASDDWNDHIRMLEYGFSVCEKTDVDGITETFTVNTVGGETNSIKCVLEEKPYVISVKGKKPVIVEKIYTDQFVYAPVIKGDHVGFAEYYAGEELLFKSEIIAEENCHYKNADIEKPLYKKLIDWLKGLFMS